MLRNSIPSAQQYHNTAARNHPGARPAAAEPAPERLSRPAERGRSFSILARQWLRRTG
jgi:hypothetical protein